MSRYFACIWDERDREQSEAVSQVMLTIQATNARWHSVFDKGGLLVFCIGARLREPEVNILPDSAGVVLGSLFAAVSSDIDQVPQRAVLSKQQTAEIIATSGKQIVSKYWGSYVAFLRDARSMKKWVLVGPMGWLSCFTMQFRGVNVYFSNMEDCVQLNLFQFSLNWNYVAAHILSNSVRCRETGITEVSDIKPGECVEIENELITHAFYWNPFDIVKSCTSDDMPKVASRVRHITMAVVRAWAACHDRIVLQLSGGLDSSVVLGCLRDATARPAISCINDYSTGSNGDERSFARLAASHANCELFEIRRNERLRLDNMLNGVRTARPFHHFMHLVNGLPSIDFACSKNATGIFTGTLGDSIFYRNRALPAAADYLYMHRLPLSLLKVAFDAALMDRLSVWTILRYAVRGCLTRNATESYSTLSSVLSPDDKGRSLLLNTDVVHAMIGGTQFIHPWFEAVNDVPPGKLWQISSLALDSADDPYTHLGGPEFVHPLMSQPLVEICLRIPIRLHINGGWDRAVARQAFVREVPVDILKRTTKGGLEEYAKLVMMKNLQFLKETLLDGVLVQKKLLNRRALEDALSGKSLNMSVTVADIMALASDEIWLKTWQRTGLKGLKT